MYMIDLYEQYCYHRMWRRMCANFNGEEFKEDEYLEMFVDLQMDVQSHKCQLLGRLKDKMHGKISASSFRDQIKTVNGAIVHITLLSELFGDYNLAELEVVGHAEE